MPANPKYLNKNPWQQFAKITAGLIGGYIITALFHMSLALWIPNGKEILITSIYTFYLVWCTLIIVPYLFKNGWKTWALYIIVALALYIVYYFGNQQNPFI